MSADHKNPAGTDTHDRHELRITLAGPHEMFTGPSAPGPTPVGGVRGWDDAGRWLGESGCERALRTLAERPHAGPMVIRCVGEPAPDAAEFGAQIRAWCDARILSNSQHIRLVRRLGLRTLVWSLALLAAALGLSWTLQSEAVLGPPGPMRAVLSEALIIAGWVMMWRPVELLFCEPMRPAYERRLLRALRDLEWRCESP